jgi:two-component system NtrC family response regulator
MSKPKLLIVEDDPGLCAQYRWAFPALRVLLAQDRRQAEAMARREQPDVVLLDLGLPPDAEGVAEGFATLAALRAGCPGLPVIVASGQDHRANQLRAIALGAQDFCEKPVDLDVLRTILDRALRLRALERENLREAAAPRPSPIAGLVTGDPAMLALCRLVERMAGAAAPVLLLGESGTGKEVLARALHDLGPRAARPFIALNCAAIPEPLLESELFGHERGAFTGALRQVPGRIEQAHQGTLFLDEIGDLPLPLQAKLLRVLQEQVVERVGGRHPIRVDVRVVSATNQALEAQATAGQFRADLLYRLNTLTLRVPPLRDRGGDALLLARWFLARHAETYRRRLRGFDTAAIAAILAHPWPGNIRELGNRIERAALLAEGPMVGVADLELAPAAVPEAGMPVAELNLRDARERTERQLIERALATSQGSVAAAARLLGVSRPTLYDLLGTHGLGALRAGAPPPFGP